MVKRSFNDILDKSKNVEGIIIVGAGVSGKELLDLIQQYESPKVVAFFDNNEQLQGKKVQGIPVLSPCNKGNEYLYVITVNNMEVRKSLRVQLENLGIVSEQIVMYFYAKDYEYLSTLNEKFYQEEISEQYEAVFGKEMDWKNPTTYTEIINWEKLNVRDKRRTLLVDIW